MPNIFSYKLIVNKDQIDELNHVNNLVYLSWMLDAAGKHWNFLSSIEINKSFVWVVLRHEIDYLQSAKINDEITVITWVEKITGVKSERIVEIKKGDILLAKGKTTWCFLGKKTMRPARIPEDVKKIFS